MANLRDLRLKATELGIAFERTTTKDQLQELIAAKELDIQEATEAPITSLVDDEFEPVPAKEPIVEEEEVQIQPDAIIDHLSRPEEGSPGIPMNGGTIGFDFTSLTDVNQGDVFEDCRNQASYYMRVGTWYAQVQNEVFEAKRRFEKTESELFCSFKTKPNTAGKPNSDEQAKMETRRHPDYQESLKAYTTTLYHEEVLKRAMKALEQKERMLMQLSSKSKEEYKQLCRMDGMGRS